jgi:ATP-binding protein involved in chromosome partitioning
VGEFIMSSKITGIIPHKVRTGITRISNIKNIIAVTSGKGGVGKSTTAFNLAIALKGLGLKVGLLDADIYGPSVPTLVAEKSFKPEVMDNCFLPLNKYGIEILSFGFLIDEKQPAIWRGAIVVKALNQLLYDTKWSDLDVMIIDMPPGTGDIALTMCQKMPITGVITVTTPQDVALVDVMKSIAMYKKMDIPCLGVIENMSMHTCSNCGHLEPIFGTLGGDKLASEFGLDLLAKLPLDMSIRESGDNGVPLVTINAEIAKIYEEAAQKMLDNLAKLPKDFSAMIGKVSVVK